jgi:hypothetical protein
MPITAKHREVEARFRRLVADAELPEPDSVDYEPRSVVFVWHGPKVSVAVDFDEPEHGRSPRARAAADLQCPRKESNLEPSD